MVHPITTMTKYWEHTYLKYVNNDIQLTANWSWYVLMGMQIALESSHVVGLMLCASYVLDKT